MAKFALVDGVITVLWLAYTIYVTVRYIRLKFLLAGLEEPELWLPRRERRAHARKLLRREDDEYTEQLIEKTTRHLRENQEKLT